MDKKIYLWDDEKVPGKNGEGEEDKPNLIPYLINNNVNAGALIVFPGGGYTMRADHEGAPLARWANSIGLNAFVLNYRVYPYQHPYPLMDAQRAIRLVRRHAEEWNIDPNRIAVMGFSAGGHLASSLGTHYDLGNKNSNDDTDKFSCRPDALILGYSVITFGEYAHEGSKETLLGQNPDENLVDFYSNELRVNKNTPPTFLWHTADDDCVPVENSLLFASALSKNKVPFEMHIFPSGPHGLGMAKDDPTVGQWVDLCGKWLKDIFSL